MKNWLGGGLFALSCVVLWWFWPEIYEGPSDGVEALVEVESQPTSDNTLSADESRSTIAVIQRGAPSDTLNPAPPQQVRQDQEPRQQPPKTPENITTDFQARDFTVPDKYPGHNLEVFEEKKVEFLIREIKLFPADAEEVSRRYVDSIEESNQVMRNRPEEAMEEMSRIVGEYEDWLRETLGDEDFARYSEFMDATMRNLQEQYRVYYENQGNNQ